MNRKHPILLIIIIISALAGCKSSQDLKRDSATQNTDIAEQETSRCPYQYMTRTFSCTAAGHNANGLIRMECERTIWMNIHKGIELGRVKMTPDSVWIHVKIFNCAWKGDYNDLTKLAKHEFHFDTLMRQLTEQPQEAENSISEIGKSFNIPIQIKIAELKGAEMLTFPINIPNNSKPLEILLSQ